ncbi:MAG: glycosyltransferase family 2 protein [Gammaproteobacteria bacterium]|nr:glycosyltransferase family 2 protein [Gammaproteobacteria bacterium]
MSSAVSSELNYMVVIPAYNEEATIKALVENVLEQKPDQLLIINDASSDKTASILDSIMSHRPVKSLQQTEALQPIQIFHNSQNLGKAGSLWRAFDQAIQQNIDVVITMDGDGQHRAEDIPTLLKAHLKHPEHLIIGARERNLKTQPLGRFLANRFANFWISWAAGYGVIDSQSGFRLYPLTLLKKISNLKKSEGFVFESEVIIEAAWQGHYTSTVNIPTIYHKNRRESHFQPLQDIKKITKMVARRLVTTHFNLRDLFAAITNRPPQKK